MNSRMQKHNESIIRKMPLPVDIDVVEGTLFSDGVVTLTQKETSHIKILSVDSDNYIVYEITPPKKVATRSLKEFFDEDHLIETVTTMKTASGEPLGQYKYYKRPNGSYYVLITGEKTSPHRIMLGKLSERDSPIASIAKVVAYSFGTKKFSRNDLKPLIRPSLRTGQKLKSLLDTLYYEGYLTRELVPSARKKPKEIYSATDKLKQVAIPSPSPEQT